MRWLVGALIFSLAGNLLFLAAALRIRDAAPAPAGRTTAVESPLEAELREERARVAELERRLAERPPAVGGEPPAPTAPPPAEPAALIARLVRAADQDPSRFDAGMEAEYASLWFQVSGLFRTSAKDPARYAAAMRAFYESALVQLGVPLSTAQNAELERLTHRARKRLEAIPARPAPERQLGGLEAERELHDGLKSVVSPEQWAALDRSILGGLPHSTSDHALEWDKAVEQVVEDWTEMYGLDAWQKKDLTPAAEAFVRAKAELDELHGPTTYEHRIGAARAHWDALRSLAPYLTSEQRARIEAVGLREYR